MHDLLRRNRVFEVFFQAEAARLAEACREMSRRFLAGGRLLALGEGAAATDASHVATEFVHPVIVGKRALPAIDLSPEFAARLPVLLRPHDMVIGFHFTGDTEPRWESALQAARARGALTFALAGTTADYAFPLPAEDPFVCQEAFEVLYHILWESVHIYFEHREQGHDVGASAFLYPFLGRREQSVEGVVSSVQESMLQKVAEVNRLREEAARSQADTLVLAAAAIARRLEQGGKLIAFGNGGSASDANDLAIDCVMPPPGLAPIPAISLAAEPACLTAIANDIGSDAIFVRQLIAHARPEDVAVAISTSGDSANLIAALAEAHRQGLLTVALVGTKGGRIVSESLADHTLRVASDHIPRIQEVQASLYHVLRRLVAKARVLKAGGASHA